MKRTLTLLAATPALVAGPALAGSMEAPAEQPVVEQPVQQVSTGPDWTGLYGGGQLGFADVDSNLPGVSGDGAIGGLTFGYDHDLGNWVVGAGLDYDWTDVNIAPTVDVENVFRAKLRGGYKIGNGLAYATGGYTNIDASTLGDDDGYFIGAGYEHMVTDRVSVGGEVLYHEVDSFAGTAADVDATTAQVRATFRF